MAAPLLAARLFYGNKAVQAMSEDFAEDSMVVLSRRDILNT